MSIFEPAQTPIPLITTCYFCGGAGLRDEMIWYGGIGGLLLHKDCEQILKDKGAIYYRWTTGMTTNRKAIQEESLRLFGDSSIHSDYRKSELTSPTPTPAKPEAE